MKKLFLGFVACLLVALPVSAEDLRIYSEEDPPYNFVGSDGKPAGFAVELLTEMQKRLGSNHPISIVPWARGYQYILHTPNVVLFTMGRTAEREALFQWVGPLITNDWIVVARRQDKLQINSLEQLAALKSVGVVRDFASHHFLVEKGLNNLDPITKNLLNVRKLHARRLDAYISTNNNYLAEIREAALDPEEFAPVFTINSVSLYFAHSRHTDPAIVALWQKTLNGMKADGSYQRILKTWFPDYRVPKKPEK